MAWTNLTETTFILGPKDSSADYKLRIFTHVRKMTFAGHPTLGSCVASQRWGGEPKAKGIVVQECGIGLVDIYLDGGRNAFVAPDTKIDALPYERLDAIIKKLGIAKNKIVGSACLENCPVRTAIELDDVETVLNVDNSLI